MKKSLVLITILVLAIFLSACGSQNANQINDQSLSQDAFLKDMASGIEDRLSKINDPKDSAPIEEWAAYYKK